MSTNSCPKCGVSFICLSSDISNCECKTIDLSKGVMSYLSEEFDSCLCIKCLEEINEMAKTIENEN